MRYGDALREVVNPLDPFDVVVSGDNVFDDFDKKIKVKLIKDSEQLQELHRRLVGVLGNLLHDPTYRQPYNPHISVKDLSDIPDERVIHIEGFTILEKVKGASWIVRDQMRLKGSQS